MKQEQTSVKGIHIRWANRVVMILSGLLFLVVLYYTGQVTQKAQALTQAADDYIFCQETAVQVSEGSDYLTEQVRLYVVTQDRTYAQNYFSEIYTTQRREQALDALEQRQPEAAENAQLQMALEKSNGLTQTELYAIGLVALAQGDDFSDEGLDVTIDPADQALSAEEQVALAQSLVFSAEYEQAKEEIAGCVSLFLSTITQETYGAQGQTAGALERITWQQRIGIVLLFCISAITFGTIYFGIIRPLWRYGKAIQANTVLEEGGFYEFRYLARTYNDMYRANAANRTLLRHEAEHDPLTGILNRGAFEKQRQLLRDQPEPMAFLLLDVDRFKGVNDTYGHETGDRVLQKVSYLLQAGFRSNDLVARLGGDEFGVIMRKATPANSKVIVEKIDAFNRIMQQPDNHLPPATLTVGVAFSEHGFSDELFQQADQALYQRKAHGRCGCEFYKGIENEELPQDA
jgi:diguanylate cyclase (GGDEF)-like protein